jgi:hypothetical protein
MRATAAHGSVDQVGRVGWSGELGYGVRHAEPFQADADGIARADAHLAARDEVPSQAHGGTGH